MAVHYNPTVRYKPQTLEEIDMIVRAYSAVHFGGTHKPKCKLCKKRMRGPGHDCKNGK